MCIVLKFGVYLYTLILLGYQASQRWRALLLRGPGQGRKLAQPSAGQAPLGLAGCSLELAKHRHAELISRDSGPVTLSCFPPTSSVGLSLKSPGPPTPQSAFPFLGRSWELRSSVSRPFRDSKRSFVFPWGQQPNVSPVFGNKASIQWGGGTG